jgi:hypothetical protein
MRQNVETLMDGAQAPAPPPHRTTAAPAGTLDAASVTAIRKARDKVIPVVSDFDRQALEPLVAALESAAPADEERCREELERELRKHAYLF